MAVTANRLTLVESERAIEPHLTGSKHSRAFLDFQVDGESLYPTLRSHGFDNITPLWPGDDASSTTAKETIARLLGQQPGDAPHGRVSLYVCAECGDLGCGAVTVQLKASGGQVSWSDWGYQTNDEETVYRGQVPTLGSFVFDEAEYRRTLVEAFDQLRRFRS